MNKAIAGTLLLLAAILLIVNQEISLQYWMKSPSQRLQQQINSDWKTIASNKTTPLEISDLREVTFSSDSSEAKDWIRQIKIPDQIKAAGHHRLEVFVTQWIDGHDYGAIIQYDLVDTKSNNTIWELSRTYKIGFIY